MQRLRDIIPPLAWLSILNIFVSSVAYAEPSAYCRKIKARASADAALLMSPQLVAQGIRSPNIGLFDPSVAASTGVYQVRVGLSFSPVDFYKGLKVTSVSDADCERHHAQRNIEELLKQVHDIGKLPALRQQVEYLESQRKQWQTLKRVAAERLDIQAITVMDFNELEKRATSLERRVAEQQGEAERIAARNYADPATEMSLLAGAYTSSSNAYEEEVNGVRSLSAWQLKLSSGIVPLSGQTRGAAPAPYQIDWYGFLEFSFNFGSLNGLGGKYLEARQQEVSSAPYELVEMLAAFQRETQARLAQARRELESVERQATSTGKARQLVQQSQAANSAQAVALLQLDEVWLESERRYLTTLADELSKFLHEVPHLEPAEKS